MDHGTSPGESTCTEYQSDKKIVTLIFNYNPRYNLNYSKFQAPPSMMKGITEI